MARRKTKKGGVAQQEKHMEDANKTGEQFAKHNKLEVIQVEGKASCWLLAVLANIDGALINPRRPQVEDRYLEMFFRSRILIQADNARPLGLS